MSLALETELNKKDPRTEFFYLGGVVNSGARDIHAHPKVLTRQTFVMAL